MKGQKAPPLPEVVDALEGMVTQFAYWRDDVGGYTTGGLSALEYAFTILGWDDPHPAPEVQCGMGGCKKLATMGTRAPMPERYRRSCWDHQPTADERAIAEHEWKGRSDG